MTIAQTVNKPDYIPRNPTFDTLGNVFETRFANIQPYLCKVSYIWTCLQVKTYIQDKGKLRYPMFSYLVAKLCIVLHVFNKSPKTS